jgi:hypothetical protein
MTKTIIEHSLNDLNTLILDGKAMEGFEKYYGDEVIMQENETIPTVGKDANRQRELSFFENITDFRGAKMLGSAVKENVSFAIWHFDYTHKEWGVRNYTQVAVQTWKEGKIVKEQYFYGN